HFRRSRIRGGRFHGVGLHPALVERPGHFLEAAESAGQVRSGRAVGNNQGGIREQGGALVASRRQEVVLRQQARIFRHKQVLRIEQRRIDRAAQRGQRLQSVGRIAQRTNAGDIL